MDRPGPESSPLSIERRRIPLGVWLALGACLVGLGLHIWRYDFLCDDAFISFRYARNLAQGHGLVFNPGFERVEGYSNFLWVLILAAGQLIGLAPEHAANPLLILMGLALVGLVVRFCWKELPSGASPYLIIIPAVMLAANRSFAMWCTSGLETKLFELLVVGGVLATVREMRAMSTNGARTDSRTSGTRAMSDESAGTDSRTSGRTDSRTGGEADSRASGNTRIEGGYPWSAVWFALAALTRPDGLLFAGCVVLTRVLLQGLQRTFRWRPFLSGVTAFAVLVGGQFIFRRLYYDEWLPNTYYAKVGGQFWWDMGVRYLKCFAMEYATVLWAPIILVAVIAIARMRRLNILAIFAAAIVPHAVYVISIGGDHFEYRVLDAYLPLVFIMFFYAACGIGRGFIGRAAVGFYIAICAGAQMILPEMSHRGFPSQYRVAFPGLMPRDNYLTEFIDSSRFPWLFRIPGVGPYVVAYNDLMYPMTRQFVGLRQEEHKGFLATAVQQGKWLRDLIDKGVLPRDLHIATDCVGAIPYYSNLRVLDRVGLTDRIVARQKNAKGEYRVMAHDKLATDEYIREMGVDISALDNVHIVLPAGHPRFLLHGQKAKVDPDEKFYADLSDGRMLLGAAPQGMAALQRRVPSVTLRPAAELVYLVLGDHGEKFTPVPPEKQFGPPYDMTYFDQGVSLNHDGFDPQTVLVQFIAAVQTNPLNPMARGNYESLSAFIEQQRAASQPSAVRP